MSTDMPSRTSPKPPLGTTLTKLQKKIQDCWLQLLSESASRSAYVIALREVDEGHSLLSSLMESLVLDEVPDRDVVENVLRNVRHKAYSITDLFTELALLQNAVEEVMEEDQAQNSSQRLAASRRVRKWSDCLFAKVLSETSEIYEYVTESGGIGFCQMDTNGKITFANEQMGRMFGDFALEGHCLQDFFEGAEAKFVCEAVRCNKSVGRELKLQRNGAQVLVSADIGPLFLDAKKIGCYASVSDITSIIQRQRQVYELSPLGICRIDSCEKFIYMNPAFKKLAGVDDYKGLNIVDLFPTDKMKITEELGKRWEGHASQYDLELVPINGRRVPVPVSVTGIPIMDSERKVCGSLAIVRDLRVERAATKIHKLIERQQSGSAHKMLLGVAEEVRKLVDFDMFVVSLLSRNQAYTREVFTYLPNREIQWSKRWYHLSPDMIDWIVSDDPNTNIINDFETFMQQPTWVSLLEDKGVKEIIRMGLNSFMRFRVYRKKRLIATVSLFLKGKEKYTQENWRILDQLPMAEAVNAALYESRRQELQFHHDLIRAIVGQQTISQVADLLVEMLGDHYKWQHISIFVIDYADELFRVLAEWHDDPSRPRISKDYTQPLDRGILGYTLIQRPRSHVKSDDVNTDPKLKDIYIETVTGATSELCIPIEFDGKVRWVLDITDSKRAAFSDEEIHNLEAVVQMVASSLDNQVALYRLTSAFAETSDAIIVTDHQNEIQQVNLAAARLLGYGSINEAQAGGNYLADHIEGLPSRTHLVATDFVQSKEVRLKKTSNGDQETVPALMSAFELPYEIPGNVFAAKDLTEFNRLKALENLGRVFYELAIQSETPISLIFSWLRRLERQEDLKDETRNLIEKISGQMRKVRITFDRLILHEKGGSLEAGDKIKLNLDTELRRSMDDLPDADRAHIEIRKEIPELPYIYADPYQISFVFQSILSYLLGVCPTKEKVLVKFGGDEKNLVVELKGFAPEPKQIGDDVSIEIARIQSDIKLGEDVILKFIENHDGHYRSRREENILAFHIELPIQDARASA